MEYDMTYDMFDLIDESGIALDGDGNELRDSSGCIFIVPVEDRHLFKLYERSI